MSDYDGSEGMKMLILENHEPLFRHHPDKDQDELTETFEDLLDEMLRRRAHELAEQIRAEMIREGYCCTTYECAAADLIDPEVNE